MSGSNATEKQVREFFDDSNSDESTKDAAVFASIKVICEGVAQLPLHIYRKDKKTKSKSKQKDHYLYEILHSKANKKQTSFSFVESMQYALLLRGNAYALKVSGRTPVDELVYIHPDFITPFCVKDGKPYFDRYVPNSKIYYNYTNQDTGTTLILFDDDILHIQGLSSNGLVGLNVIEHLALTLGYSIAAREHGARYFKQGGHPSVVMEFANKKGMDDATKEKLRKAWVNRFSGTENSHQCLIVEGGTTVKPLNLTNKDSQFLESRKYQRSEIAAIFSVPPHKIGDLENASFSNIEQQSRDFVNHTIMPWNIRWEQALNHSLLTRKERKDGFSIRFNVDGLLRGDSEARAKLYTVLFNTSSITPNEIREMENMNPIANGDNTFAPMNMQPIKEVGKNNE
ncbi:MAG: phage portal protein [Immundisolibacteraceae bacterium]|nr:phage portal protein [Immundisolibacteraceae bacterium]